MPLKSNRTYISKFVNRVYGINFAGYLNLRATTVPKSNLDTLLKISMEFKEFILVLLMSIPACGALVGGLLLYRLMKKGESPLGRKPLTMAIVSFALSVLVWVAAAFCLSLPKAYAVTGPVLVTAVMFFYVFIYRFIFEVTRVDSSRQFSQWHYLFPVPVLILFKWQQFPLLLPVIVFNIIYLARCLYRAFEYRKAVVDYSADEQRGAIRWIYHLVYLMLAILSVMIGLLALSGAIRLVLLIILALIAVLKYAILAHNVLLENFVVIGQGKKEDKDVAVEYSQADIQRLEEYMLINKPYLKPKLKITDMTVALATNRTSLSALINRHHGMNFCRYVNRFRLEELERLRSDPANTHLSEMDLIYMAGFSDLRGYKRVIHLSE